MRDLYSNDVETAAALARADEDYGTERPSPSEYREDDGPSCTADLPVTLEDFAPRIPTPDDDPDLPF